MTLEDASFGGTFEDLQNLAKRAPQVITALVKIATKAEAQIPMIIRIVDKAGDQLPKVLKIIDKVGDQLPRVIHVIETAEPYYPLILRILQDPQFPDVVKRVQKVIALHAKMGKKSGFAEALGAAPPASAGLGPVIKGLDAYIWVKEHPAVVWGGVAATVLVLFGTGFAVGRLTAKRGG